ncbi:FAD-dependent oxidoreductase [Streptomyces sp. NPDC051940]|uniref:FAD-dependent oxidoreductase n=1 Tax=Streptomyces sp. NPDC051940 TaxID=3155675 RepID=UPI0034267D7D
MKIARRTLLALSGSAVLFGGMRFTSVPAPRDVDLVVYGGTSAGIAAAVQMRRMGGTVVVLEPSRFLGGLTTSGLGFTDIGANSSISGIAREFYRRVDSRQTGVRFAPGSPARFAFKPGVAAAVMAELVREAGVPVVFDARLVAVGKAGNRLTSVMLEDGTVYQGRMFIDATYEGDLMARAGVSFTVGREGNERYGELHNGVQHRWKHQFNVRVDPYVTEGSPGSGLLPGISREPLAPDGTPDDRVQAFCYRMCLTQAKNRIPFTRPDRYEPIRYELLLRYIRAGWPGPFFTTHFVGDGKTDSNNYGAFSTDGIGLNYAYPAGSWGRRESIADEQRAYQQGLLWFLSTDRRVPPDIRSYVRSWGLPSDEFRSTDGWPPLLYVREGRRMVADYVMTEHDCSGQARASDSVALASYTMDSHNCQRVVIDGAVRNEGDVQVRVREPYPISYRSIVPREKECENLLVPVAVSASHIAYGSIRMEPVFMMLAQSAATAARQAMDTGVAVQRLPIAPLQRRLRKDGLMLEWLPPAASLGQPVQRDDPHGGAVLRRKAV